jgi:hypothetical protein
MIKIKFFLKMSCLGWFPLLLLFSCTSNVNNKLNRSFFRDSFPEKEGKELFESINKIRDSLKLDTLENGFDSLQIRIWLADAHKQEVIIIKNKKGVWDAEFILFRPILNKKMDSVLFFAKNMIRKEPKEPWPSLINKLINYHILTLPDQGRLSGYEHPYDGLNTTFEIATKTVYRLYSYHEPGVNKQLQQARDVVNILDTIKSEFDVVFFENEPADQP